MARRGWFAFRLNLSFRFGIYTILLLLPLLFDFCSFGLRNSSSFALYYHSSPSLLILECYSLTSTCFVDFFGVFLGFDLDSIFMFYFSDFFRGFDNGFLFDSLFGFLVTLVCFGLYLSLSVVNSETIYRVVFEL